MHPRQLRVGDLVDDYCPRERRLSNHAIVALVGDDIRQVRCTTCDAEHEYKGGKAPASRKKKLAADPRALAPVREQPAAPAVDGGPASAEPPSPPAGAASSSAAAAPEAPPPADAPEDQPPSPHAEISLHRRLIRATLPRIESDAPSRPIPEFTMHRAAQPGHSHRHGKPFRQGPGGGPHRPGKGGFGQGRHGQGEANGNTFGSPRGGHGQRGAQGGQGGAHGTRPGPGGPRGHGGAGGHGIPQGPRHPRHGFGRGPKKH
jgi:translation initiation factor IF-2